MKIYLIEQGNAYEGVSTFPIVYIDREKARHRLIEMVAEKNTALGEYGHPMGYTLRDNQDDCISYYAGDDYIDMRGYETED